MKPPEAVVRAPLIKAADTPINFALLKKISDFALNEEEDVGSKNFGLVANKSSEKVPIFAPKSSAAFCLGFGFGCFCSDRFGRFANKKSFSWSGSENCRNFTEPCSTAVEQHA